MSEVKPTQIPPTPEPTQPTYSSAAVENPMEGGAAIGVRGGANMYGACSLEKFCQVGGLGLTHEDANGWLDYVRQFTPINFWFQDAGVKVWLYTEPYDDWQDTYGMDAVCAFYHSGHGGMDANGVFYAPLGADWAKVHDCTAISNQMVLGNERARYIFWSTCLSLRVFDGHNPIRTWHGGNRGWRMMFGFETTSWDDPNYGSNFWKHWRAGDSFGSAWLNGSWDIAHDQAPSVVACGATAEEAKNRVFNERYFDRNLASSAWYWWRWYNVAAAAREPQRLLPKNLLIARLQPVAANQPSISALADRFQMGIRLPSTVARAPNGSFQVTDGDMRIAYSGDGSFNVQLAKPNLANHTPIATRQALTQAQEAIRRYGLDQQAPLVFDRVLLSSEAGGTPAGSGQIEGPYTTGTIVQFRQTINGIPVITPSAGTVRVAIDNDGTVTEVHSAVRAIDQLSDRPLRTVAMPSSTDATAALQATEPENYEQQLAAQFSKRLAVWAVQGTMPVDFTTVPGSTEIGYDLQEHEATLIARKAMEVDFGNGYRKRYWVTTPLFA